MGYTYAIKQMREALLKLGDHGTLSERLSAAISELEEPTNKDDKPDLTPEHLEERDAIVAEYNAYAVQGVTHVDESGEMVASDPSEIEKRIADKIVGLAVDVIEANTILQKESDDESN